MITTGTVTPTTKPSAALKFFEPGWKRPGFF